jgi:hypothetical protein
METKPMENIPHLYTSFRAIEMSNLEHSPLAMLLLALKAST